MEKHIFHCIIGNSPAGHLNSSLHRLFYIYICSSFKPDNLHNGGTKLRLQGTFRLRYTVWIITVVPADREDPQTIWGVGVFTKDNIYGKDSGKNWNSSPFIEDWMIWFFDLVSDGIWIHWLKTGWEIKVSWKLVV